MGHPALFLLVVFFSNGAKVGGGDGRRQSKAKDALITPSYSASGGTRVVTFVNAVPRTVAGAAQKKVWSPEPSAVQASWG